MKYGFVISGGDIRGFAELAYEAEEAGWDGVFLPDCICIVQVDEPGFDPWVALTAMAMRTKRVILGPMLTPPSRRRPWKLARETASLDLIAGGRTVLPVGLGALDDGGFGAVGDATDRKERADLLDESLDILVGLWTGEPFSYAGKHFKMQEMKFTPPPVQQPRIPIWVVGLWPAEKSMRRVLRWDGLLPNKARVDGVDTAITPQDIAAMKNWIDQHRQSSSPFDIVMEGVTPGDDSAKAAAMVRPYAEAGATWWLEADWNLPARGNYDLMLQRIRQGPPRFAEETA